MCNSALRCAARLLKASCERIDVASNRADAGLCLVMGDSFDPSAVSIWAVSSGAGGAAGIGGANIL